LHMKSNPASELKARLQLRHYFSPSLDARWFAPIELSRPQNSVHPKVTFYAHANARRYSVCRLVCSASEYGGWVWPQVTQEPTSPHPRCYLINFIQDRSILVPLSAKFAWSSCVQVNSDVILGNIVYGYILSFPNRSMPARIIALYTHSTNFSFASLIIE
jgi:hypothetical protein